MQLNAFDFFNYWPSLALAIIALVLFTLAAVVVGIMTERRRLYRCGGWHGWSAVQLSATSGSWPAARTTKQARHQPALLQHPSPTHLPSYSPCRFMHTISITGLLEAGGYAALIYCIEQSGKASIYNSCERWWHV